MGSARGVDLKGLMHRCRSAYGNTRHMVRYLVRLVSLDSQEGVRVGFTSIPALPQEADVRLACRAITVRDGGRIVGALPKRGHADPDPGFFGPQSQLWQVLRERTVVMGGMRALLMHAAHPLVSAAAVETGLYERDTLRRHERTLRLTFTLVFGARSEAISAARTINAAHRQVHGFNHASGCPYDARDPELLLWVHASLMSSFLLYERLTVRRLDEGGREQFHAESTRLAGLLGLPAARIPPRAGGLDAWIDDVADGGVLRACQGARLISDVMRRKASGAEGYASRVVGFMALHTLPPALRDYYGVSHDRADERKVRALALSIRAGRQVLPRGSRFIGSANAGYARMRGTAALVSETAVLPRRWRMEPSEGH
jgi:uncharacterized protein (DUF2236 family)